MRLQIDRQLHNYAELGISQERLDRLDHAFALTDPDRLTDLNRLVVRQMPGRHDLVATA
jgi:hypothetical protein